MVVLGEVVVSYEQGTPVVHRAHDKGAHCTSLRQPAISPERPTWVLSQQENAHPPRTLGIGLMQGPRGRRFLMNEVHVPL